jgi:hypothetical protein
MEPMTDRNKAGWIIAATIVGWIFFILPTSGDDFAPQQPISDLAWINWGIINIVMLIIVHLLISKEHRANKRYIKTLKRVARMRASHPTVHTYE